MIKLLIYLILIKVVSWGSKPTVWDGDNFKRVLSSLTSTMASSKPTVWDGDSKISKAIVAGHCSSFQAHCVGWRRNIDNFFSANFCRHMF